MAAKVVILSRNTEGLYSYLLRVPVPLALKKKFTDPAAKSLLPDAVPQDHDDVRAGAVAEFVQYTQFREAPTFEKRHISRAPKVGVDGQVIRGKDGMIEYNESLVIIPAKGPATNEEKVEALLSAWRHKKAELDEEALRTSADPLVGMKLE